MEQRALTDGWNKGFLQSHGLTYFDLIGDPHDLAKLIPAWYGQGRAALHVHGLMLNFFRDGIIPTLQVHDELDIEFPVDWSDKRIKEEFTSRMECETWRLPGFNSPIDVFRGNCWKEGKTDEDFAEGCLRQL